MRALGSRFATVCLKRRGSAAALRGFVEILNAGLIDQCTQASALHLDRMQIIPIYGALNLLTVFHNKNHRGLAMNLLLKIKCFCMRIGPSSSAGTHSRRQWWSGNAPCET